MLAKRGRQMDTRSKTESFRMHPFYSHVFRASLLVPAPAVLPTAIIKSSRSVVESSSIPRQQTLLPASNSHTANHTIQNFEDFLCLKFETASSFRLFRTFFWQVSACSMLVTWSFDDLLGIIIGAFHHAIYC
jgi:hypothetical protein